MKAEITVKIIHTVDEFQVPPRTFTQQERMELTMPVDPAEFADSVESLLVNSLVSVTTGLCTKVTKQATKYADEIRRTGLAQLELPLSNE